MPTRRARATLAAAASVALALVVGGSAMPADAATTGSTPASPDPAHVAIVVPVSLPITTGSFLTADQLSTATAPDGVLSQELDAVSGTRVTLAIDPLLIASIRILGSQAPESARAWLGRLAEVRNPTFALSYADADITAPLQAGVSAPLALGSLAYGIDSSRFGAAQTPAPTASADPGDDADDSGAPPPLPTTDELLEWHYTQDSVAWPRAGTVTNADLPALGEAYGTTLVSSTNALRSHRTLAASDIRGAHVVVTDDVVSGLVMRALDASDDDEFDAARTALTSAVVAYQDASQNAVVVDRAYLSSTTASVDPERLAEVVQAIEDAASTRISSLASVSDAATTYAHVVDAPQPKARVALVAQMLAAERGDAQFASVADDPGIVRGQRRAELLVALSSASEASTSSFSTAANAYLDASQALLGSVRVEKPSSITLLADRASIFVSVTNDLDVPVTVDVSVRPSAPLISVEQPSVEVQLEAHSQRKASVPVQSLSNGTVALVVTLTSRSGVRAGDPIAVTTSVRAGWEGPVTIGLAVLAVLLFAFGVWRALLQRRRKRAAAAAEAPHPDASPTTVHPDASPTTVHPDGDPS